MSNNKVQDYAKLMKMASDKIAKLEADFDNIKRKDKSESEPIAIIGMGCRFPGGASTPKRFWELLKKGVDAITEVPRERWNLDDYYDPDPESPGKIYTRYGGFIEQIDEFDANFFGISPREAIHLDPQQRLLLEVSWEAIEYAGRNPQELNGSKTGVFIGICGNDYSHLVFHQDPEKIDAYAASGNAHSTASGRISYIFGLLGPSLAVDTACSSSLVSIHLACSSLRKQECNLALAGGVNRLISPEGSIAFSKARMLSFDGRCKTFDASADGFVRGEGCGMVVLKRLSDAIADRDNILAVIRGTAINQDGHTSGLTVPNGPSQQAVIRQALENGGVEPANISYFEAHGTGTSLGDPIEVGALGTVFGTTHSQEQPLIVGSVKTNIGHLEGAAGIAGLMKVVLQMQNQQIVPSLHFNQPNPYINWSELPVKIPTQTSPWSTNGKSRMAGVSSFGFGGTNAHVILEEAPIQESQVKDSYLDQRPCHILTLSAKCEKALQELGQRYGEFLGNNSTASIADICFTAHTGRSHFNHRLAIITSDKQELADQLVKISAGEKVNGVFSGKLHSNRSPKIAFLFTGQGSQYINMGRQLYETQPVFRQTLDQCEQILQSYLEKSLLDVIYPENTKEINNSVIDQTAYTQPALFAIEYALAQLWQSWGIKPDVVMGHSVGEYVAATVAGVFSLEDGLKLVAHRGRLMQQLPSGGEMVAVMASFERVNQVIAPYTEKVAIAAINGPVSVVISGAAEAIGMVRDSLEAEVIKTKQLQVSHAFHSPLMEPMLADFEAVANQITYHQPRIPLISNVTGARADERIATTSYWVNHVSQPVKFAQSMETLHQEGYEVFLEIGPKPILLGMARQCLPEGVGVWLPSLRSGQGDWPQILQSLGELYVQGVKVDWSGFDQDYSRNKVVLPTYPFQQQRYWIETDNNLTQKKQFLSGYENLYHNLFTLSAESEPDLASLIRQTLKQITNRNGKTLEEICYGANLANSHADYRFATVSVSCSQLEEDLKDYLSGDTLDRIAVNKITDHEPKIAFVYTGHGSQYWGMGKELYDTQPTFRKAFDHCNSLFSQFLDKSLLEILYTSTQDAFDIDETSYVQPALFALQYALTELWKSWGIQPSLVLGASTGEYAAAVTAGAFSLEDGCKLISALGQLTQSLPREWQTLGISGAPEEKVTEVIEPFIPQVAHISKGGWKNMITGEPKVVASIASQLAEQGFDTRYLQAPYGFHSYRMEPILPHLEKTARELNYTNPTIDFVSTVLGKITLSVATPEYWVKNARLPVELSTTLQTCLSLGYKTFIEIGPKGIVSGIGSTCIPEDYQEQVLWLPSIRENISNWKQLLQCWAWLYVKGATLNWQGLYEEDKLQNDVTTIFLSPIIDAISQGKIDQVARELTSADDFSPEEERLLPKLLQRLFDKHQLQKETLVSQTTQNWLYELAWQPVSSIQKYSTPKSGIGQWLIFADREGVGDQLATQIEQQGGTSVIVYWGETREQISWKQWRIRLGEQADYLHMCQTLVEGQTWQGVVHLWSLDSNELEELTVSSLQESQQLGCASVLYLVQALNQLAEIQSIPDLWLITQGSQAVEKRTNLVQVQQSPLWGLGRVIMLEHPELNCRLLDLDINEGLVSNTQVLVKEMLSPDGENQLAYRQAKRYGARLKWFGDSRGEDTLSVKETGSYLITGGLGALGLEVAQWLVEKGAQHLVLTSRRVPNQAAQKVLNQLHHKGVKINVIQGDVAQSKDVERLLAEIEVSMPSLRGIIHAAGVLDDGVLIQQSWDRFEKVMFPKIAGSWNLHQQTKHLPLDFFVCFSSVASLLGSSGQGNYAAANAFMDALAHHRRGMGLPGLSINWGPWAEGGMAARLGSQHQNRMLTQGVSPISLEGGLQILANLLAQDLTQVGVLPINWCKFFKQLPVGTKIPLLEAFTTSTLETKLTKTKRNELSEKLESVPEGERYDLLRTHIQLEVAKVLGLNDSQLPGFEQEFLNLGMDSLTAMELRNRISQLLGVTLPLSLTYDFPNIEQLTKHISSQVLHLNTIEQLPVVLGSNSSTKLWSPLVPIQPNGSLPPFFCVPGSGGNVLYFSDLAGYFGEDQPFYGLQAQGLDGETQPLQSIEEIASQNIKAIQTVQPVGPYFLGGHSFGGLVAFEMAQQLQCQGQSVAFLAILDIFAPVLEIDFNEDFANMDNAQLIHFCFDLLEKSSKEKYQFLSLSDEALASFTPEEQINYFKQKLEIIGLLPPGSDIKLAHGFLQVLQNQAMVFNSYCLSDNTYQTPITLFRAQEGNFIQERYHIREVNLNLTQEQFLHFSLDPAWGWNHFSNGKLEIHTVSGNHYSMLNKPHAKVLAEKLQKSLEQARIN
jgi:malonyl CoA-acyl carrier protein transacylase